MKNRVSVRGRWVRRVMALAATLGLVGATAVVLAVPVSASGSMIVTVTKDVVGTPPGGATYSVDYVCDAGGPSGTMTFDAAGNPTSVNVIAPSIVTTCTFTETLTGSAANVAYTCTNDSPSAATCSAGGNAVTHTVANATVNVAINITNAYANVFGPLSGVPTEATPGQAITVSGTGCTKALFGGSATTGGTVHVSVDFPTPIALDTTAAGTTGAWSVQFTVPADATGTYTVSAECGDPVPYAPVTFAVGVPTPVVATPSVTG